MALDPKFLISANLQENFIDKDTGCPLASGTVEYYSNNDQITPKDVYVLSGTAPNYTYVNIGSVVELNAAGATSYLGNDVKVYYYPLDANGAEELYFIRVKSSSGAEQFTREAWPNPESQGGGGGSGGDSAFTNYIANGQFRAYNDLPDDGVISDETTDLALGKWTFDRPSGSGATDSVTFERFSSYIDDPTGHPRYAARIVNSGGGSGDITKDLRYKFDDVNKFGSDVQLFTFQFDARTTAGDIDVDLVLIKNYGTGGSAQTETSIQTFSITASYSSYMSSFVFGDNADKTIGTEDDDFLQLAIRFPIGSSFEAEVTNFILLEGEFTSEVVYPETTTRQMISQAIWDPPNCIPDPLGFDLYCPLLFTPDGVAFSRAHIGNVVTKTVPTLKTGELWADGSTYLTSEYSPDGIPFARLQSEYFDDASSTPIYGTGTDEYLISYAATNQLLIVNNDSGSVTDIVDGAVPTGFTFEVAYNATGSIGSDIDIDCYVLGSGKLWIADQVQGTRASAPNAGNSGFSVGSNFEIEGNDKVGQEFDVLCVSAASLATGGAGKYWEFSSTTTNYYLWYQVTSETDPSIGGRTGIKVKLNAADTATQVSEKTAAAIQNKEASLVQTNDASTLTGGEYFDIDSTDESIYVWYTKDGAGLDPAPANRTAIQVDVVSSDDADAVSLKTQIAINSYKFRLPDFRGLVLKGAIMGISDIYKDPDVAFRFSTYNYRLFGDNLGSEQHSTVKKHKHDATTTINPILYDSQGSISGPQIQRSATLFSDTPPSQHTAVTNIDYYGEAESRQSNISVFYAILY